MAITGTDLMSTQTGGAGETIQAQPLQSSSPEQFAANISPQPQQVQAPAPQAEAIPAPEVPTETQQAEQVQAQQPQLTSSQILQQQLGLNPVESPEGPEPLSEQESISSTSQSRSSAQELPDGLVMADLSELGKTEEKPLIDLTEETQQEYVAPKITTLPDGLTMYDPEADQKLETKSLNKEYSASGIQIDDKGKIKKVKTEVEGPKPDGIYRYPGVEHLLKKEGGKWYRDANGDGKFELIKDGAQRLKLIEKQAYQEGEGAKPEGTYTLPSNPGAVYKKEGDQWSVDFEGKGNFIPITKGDVKARVEGLEKDAEPLKPKTLEKAGEILGGRVGTLSDFNMDNVLVNNGERIVSETNTFDKATKDYKKPGEAWERYNPDGTLNMAYDPQLAKQKELGFAPVAGKPDGEYRFPGNKNSYKKEDGKWLIKPVGTDKFVPLTKGDVQSRIDQLEKNAYKPIAIKDAVGLAKKGNLTWGGLMDNTNDVINQFSGNIDDYKKSFDEANNFATNDLNTIYKDDLSEEQKAGLRQYQDQIKKIIADGEYSTSKGVAVSKILKDAKAFFESSKEINQKITEAYQNNQSLDRLSFENKRKTYQDNLGTTGVETDSQKLSRETFEATSGMAQFILDNVDDGKIRYDRKSGGYVLSPNLDAKERQFIEEKLQNYIDFYENTQRQKYNETNENLLKSKQDKYLVKENIDKLEERLAYMQKNGLPGQIAVYDELRKQRYLYAKLENKIEDLELSKGTVFLTQPEKIAEKIGSNLSEDATDVFNSVPDNVTPKQKFDLFYERLQAENDKIAKDNGIDAQGMSNLSMRVKDLLDWDGYYQLSNAEKRYLKNLATLKQLAPLYYNNDTGITKESAGFWESFMDSLRQTLLPNTSAADNHATATVAAATQLQKIQEEGFSPDDLLDKEVMDRLDRRASMNEWNREKIGSMGGTTGGIILPLIVTGKIPSTALRSLSRLEKLITGTKDASKVADFVTKAEKVYDAALSSTKFGRFLKPAIEEGAKFELAGRVVGSTSGELNWLSGMAGGAASEAFTLLISKMPANQALEYVRSIFGENTVAAVKAMAKLGKAGGKATSRGIGETVEETAQELSSVYQSTDNWKDMKAELEARFGTFDKVQDFVISSFVMGAAFGIVDGNKAKEILNAMPEAKKNQVLDAMGAITQDLKKAEDAVDEFADNKLKQQEIVYRTGAPSATGGGKTTKEKINDTENKQGASGEERVGEEPKQAEPVAEPSKEETRPSGVVQEEQGKAEEVKASMFEDYGKIKKIKNPQEKKAAIDEFNATHNNMYKRAESIDKNFNGIFRSLNKLNLVKKEC